jgi:predicted permease
MTSAMFTVFEGLLLRKLPITDQERVVMLEGAGKGAAANEIPVNLEQYLRFRDQTSTLTDVAGFAHWGVFAFALRDGERPLLMRQSAVTGNFFQVLGVDPALGRLLEPADDRAWGPLDANAGDFNIVISYNAWRRVFGGDPDIIGHRLDMPVNNWDPVIVGVAPPGLDFPRGVDYWIPANYVGMNLIGRLLPGATVEAARVDYFNFIDNDPDYAVLGPHTLTASVQPLAEAIVGDVRPALLALTAAVGLLLLLACVNIGNLLVLRAAGRVRELAIRRALGAGSLTIVRELFAESALLAVAGGLVGFGLARFFLKVLLRLAPDVLPRSDVIGAAGAPLAIAAGVTLLTLLLFGLLPAIGSLRFDLSSPLRADARAGTEGRRLRRLRQVLVASQIALALVVLAGAGLLVRSFARLAALQLGYPTEQLSLISVAPPYDRYVQDLWRNPPNVRFNRYRVHESLHATAHLRAPRSSRGEANSAGTCCWCLFDPRPTIPRAECFHDQGGE